MDGVDWTHRAGYMLARHGITVSQAAEALADRDAVMFDPDPASRSGRSIRVIGWSALAGAILTIVIVRYEGRLFGSNGWRSNERDIRIYSGT